MKNKNIMRIILKDLERKEQKRGSVGVEHSTELFDFPKTDINNLIMPTRLGRLMPTESGRHEQTPF